MKMVSIVSVIFFSVSLHGMGEYADLKEQLEREFTHIVPSQPESSSPPCSPPSISSYLSCASFLELVQQNDVEGVKNYLGNEQFKAKVSKFTLISAYNLAKRLPTTDLRYGISNALKNLFPRQFKLFSEQELLHFAEVVDNNKLKEIATFLKDQDFLDKAPIFVLRDAQAQLRARGHYQMGGQLGAIIKQKRQWIDTKN